MLAREKPHCGRSGVPFMNSTTGAEATALSIAVRISVERRRIRGARGNKGEVVEVVERKRVRRSYGLAVS